MRTVVEILASVLTSGIGVAAVIWFSVRRRLHRSNRLVSGRRSGAPASWLWSPRRAAMLHRRLRSCCQVALQAATAAGSSASRQRPPRRFVLRLRPRVALGPFERLAGEVIAQAVELDARLIVADQRAGSWRRQALAELTGDVRRLESSTRRMESLARAWQAQLGGAQPVGPALVEQLDALEAALSELRIPMPCDHA